MTLINEIHHCVNQAHGFVYFFIIIDTVFNYKNNVLLPQRNFIFIMSNISLNISGIT